MLVHEHSLLQMCSEGGNGEGMGEARESLHAEFIMHDGT